MIYAIGFLIGALLFAAGYHLMGLTIGQSVALVTGSMTLLIIIASALVGLINNPNPQTTNPKRHR